MENFSLQSISSIPVATAYNAKSNNNLATNSQNPAAPYVSAINKYAQEKENTEKTLKQQLMEIKREEEKQIDDDMLAKMMLEEASLSNKLKGKKGLELAFDARIELVKGVKSTLEVTKEQVNNI